MNYFNENDPVAAAWLRQLIAGGHIAFGIVDERSIEDVRPSDLAGFTQCHFFAGVGVWSYALRLAGWPDHRPVWTASCPCQPFSAAGQGAGFDDKRHLWPALEWLARHAKPRAVPMLGEQVASKDGLAWLDLVSADMEGQAHALGAVDTCAAGFGAPHIRQRLYWVADAHVGPGGQGSADVRGRPAGTHAEPRAGLGGGGVSHGLAHSSSPGLEGGNPGAMGHERPTTERSSGIGGLGHPHDRSQHALLRPEKNHTTENLRSGSLGGPRRPLASGDSGQSGGVRELDPKLPGPTNGLWAAADWLACRDGKWRPVEPGTFPLAHGAPARVGRLRGYGNALTVAQAEAFISAYIDAAVITDLHSTP